MLQPITWTGRAVRLLDQTKLPRQTAYVEISDEKQMHDAIRRLVVRGAPAIGVAAAFGVYLGVKDAPPAQLPSRLREVAAYLATSRPTAVNLFWALDRIKRIGTSKERILQECQEMIEEDHRTCRAIGAHGLQLLDSNRKSQIANILTHCNAGGLATAGYGTALAPIYLGIEQGRQFHVYADETRPLLQGSRITAYELKENGVPVTVICDNMAAVVLSQKKIDACIVGADRIAANGDTANKIGTLGVAIAAKHYGVPFYVAAPTSTIDLATKTGAEIPIEQRPPEEVAEFGQQPTAPQGVDIYNPAFDVTPAALITAIITENGVALPPFEQSLRNLCETRKENGE
ncbi:MAG: methylthioribose-phosphate isomerase [Humisphaera sp.]|nr:methylthioribose-phosphate isomerase [Humisphaera sp.]